MPAQEQTIILVNDTWVSRSKPSVEVTVLDQNDRLVTISRGIMKETMKRADFLAMYEFSRRTKKWHTYFVGKPR